MEKKCLNNNMNNSKQLQIDFDAVEKRSMKLTSEARIISISSSRNNRITNEFKIHLKEKIYKDIIKNSHSY